MTMKLTAEEPSAVYKVLRERVGVPFVRLGEVAEVKAGFGFPEYLQGKTTGNYPFYKVGDISSAWKANQVGLVGANHYVDEADLATLKARPLPTGTIVFAKIGAAIGLNRRCVLTKPSLVDNNVFGLIPNARTADTRYLFQFMCSVDLMPLARATTVPSLRKGDVEELLLPMPSLERQRQIADYLDEQLSRLDASVAALLRAQANLKRYRASVLKAACEGRLVPTEAELARTEGRTFETGEQLASRIVSMRRATWSGRTKFKEPESPSAEMLPQSPAGWAWVRLDAIAEVTGGLAKSASRVSTSPMREVAYLRVANVQRGYFDLSEIKTILATERDVEELKLLAGDVLFNEGGDRDKLGRGHVWNGEIAEAIHQNHVLRARAPVAMVLPTYLSICGNGYGIEWFSKFATQSVNLASISLSTLRKFPIALPPCAEQHRIVAEADRRLSLIRGAEAQVRANLARAKRLRQSILQAAFAPA